MYLFRSNRWLPALAVTAVALASAGCDTVTGDNGFEGNSALIGPWVAVSGLVTDTADAGRTLDIIRDQGGFLALVLEDNGAAYANQFDTDAQALEYSEGTWLTSGDQLFLTLGGEADTLAFRVETDGHVVLEAGVVEVDFDGDTIPDAGTLDWTLASAEQHPDPIVQGDWDATSVMYTSVADTTQKVDLVADGGIFQLALSSIGTYQLNRILGGPVESEGGFYIALEGLLWLDQGGEGQVELMFYSSEGAGITLVDLWELYDVDDDGTAEPATLEMYLTPSG